MLRHCLPASIRQTLDQLPESLDETYLRVLGQIPQANQAHAHRMLQCLMVAVRPLRVEELAELLAFEFDAARGGIPKYRAAWRLDDQAQAVLSTCSSLVTIVYDYQSRSSHHVVQFSHFSVKEYLISNRLGGFSRYHIRPASAHTIFTQACLGSLLHLDKNNAVRFPLSRYAAQHWVEHAYFEDVASCVKDGMETLFDPDRHHFSAWIGIYDIDYWSINWLPFLDSVRSSKTSNPNPLYYSVLCGFYDLVKHLAIKHPQLVNAVCGRYRYSLFAALLKGHFEVAELLLEHNADVDARARKGGTLLIEVISRASSLFRPTLNSDILVIYERMIKAAQFLVRNNADINSQGDDGKTPLHLLSESLINEAGVLDLALLLLKHGAALNTRDNDNQTPLHLAVRRDRFKLAVILLECGADARAEDNKGDTPLCILVERLIYDKRGLSHFIKHKTSGSEHDTKVNRKDARPLYIILMLP